jgi:sec-independent protein translocase protein TatA
MPRGPEIWILLLVLLVLFGAKRLPGAARSLGQSMRILKAETKGLHEDETANPAPAALPVPPAAGAPVAPPAQDQQATGHERPLHQ